jgi:hypothetical protein
LGDARTGKWVIKTIEFDEQNELGDMGHFVAMKKEVY